MTIDETFTFSDLNKWLLNNVDDTTYNAVITRYKRILKLAKAVTPEELKEFEDSL